MYTNRGQGAIVESLLDRGADVNKKAIRGWTALHGAAQKGHLNGITKLVSKGASIDMHERKNGQTALWLACFNGHLDVAQYLASEGADIEMADNNGFTPLHVACQQCHVHIAEYLLSRGADLNKEKHNGSTALHLAISHGKSLDIREFSIAVNVPLST